MHGGRWTSTSTGPFRKNLETADYKKVEDENTSDMNQSEINTRLNRHSPGSDGPKGTQTEQEPAETSSDPNTVDMWLKLVQNQFKTGSEPDEV